ncbi:MAG: hypothetical protein JO019_03950 [Candidatus Kaiserbacteria bacterium]|nr:hypothetical protein [Candidatus Kaiserbacteria bacterium]
MKKEYLVGLVVVVLIGAGLYFYIRNSSARYDVNRTPYSVLIGSNDAFAKGQQLLRTGQPDAAKAQFDQALASAKDKQQEGQIKFKIASAVEAGNNYGNYAASIPLFKEIAANTDYTPITRAYAIQELGLIYFNFTDPKITQAIFSDDQFAKDRVAGDDLLSYRHLFEEASKLYPLAASELRIADWYANQILAASDTGTKVPADDPYKTVIRTKLASAENDIARISKDDNEKTLLPVILQRKAIILAKLSIAGDDSFGNPWPIFDQALQLYQVRGVPQLDGYVRYSYASLLAKKYGDARSADIQKILSPFYTGNTYTSAPVVSYFKNQRVSSPDNNRQYILALAKIDPKFKSWLESLGWQSSDFK